MGLLNMKNFHAIFSIVFICILPFTSFADASKEVGVGVKEAVFAGGCFWCMEPPFDKLDGVLSTDSGYIGGKAENADYKKVSAGRTKHVEALRVTYDSAEISYQQLLNVFWRNVDPFDQRGQFCDKGNQYKSYIYYGDMDERALAETSLEQVVATFDRVVATKVLAASTFYPAETYHQDYYLKNPIRYKFYRSRCGRDDRLKTVWGKQSLFLP